MQRSDEKQSDAYEYALGVYDGQEALEVDARGVMDLDDVRLFTAEVQLCETRRVALEEMAMHVV